MNIGPVTDKQLAARRARLAAAALAIETDNIKRQAAAEARREAEEEEAAEYEGMVGILAANAVERLLGPSTDTSIDIPEPFGGDGGVSAGAGASGDW